MPKNNAMADAAHFCFILDCHALRLLAKTTNNQTKDTALTLLSRACIMVPSKVIQEFEKYHPDEAGLLSVPKAAVLRYERALEIGVGRFSDAKSEPYVLDPFGNSDWYAGGVAHTYSVGVYTDPRRIPFYSDGKVKAVRSLHTITECAACPEGL